VTAAAIDQFQILARRMPAPFRVYILMTLDARHVAMNGCRVSFFGHVDRHFLAAAGAREFRVGVTGEAVLIVLGWCGECRKADNYGDQGKQELSMTTLGESMVR
jgi:hypothetical protein